MVAKVSDPYPVFYDLEGDPLEAGYIYIGEYELDPVGNPKPAYWDVALTVPATQPVRTLAGRPINEGSQIGVLYVSGEYSILVQDNLEQLVVSDDVETCQTFAERAEAAAAVALAGNVYLTRAEAQATVVPVEANLIWVFHDDVPCLFQRSETEIALTTLGSVTWKAAEGKDSYLQHWGVSTYDTRELARTAVTSMTTIERTAHQAAIERAHLDAEGTLMLNGWVEVLDEIIVGQRCVPDVIDGIAGESLSCGLFFTSRFNMTADSCYTAGATGSGSYAPYIKGLSIALDISESETAGQLAYSVVVAPATVERIAAYDAAIASGSTVSEAEAAGQLAYDNYLTANPLVLPAAIAASNVDFGAALPNYPAAFVGKEAFGVLETARITGMCRDSSSKWIAPTFGATNDDNVGGWEIKNLQLSGVDQDLRIENGFHFLKLGRVDDWVWDLGPRAQDYRNRDVTAGVKREAMYFGRLDSLIADHVGMFQGGQIVYDKGEGNSITDQFGNVQLDGDGASLTLRSGRSQIGRLYGTEDVSVPSLGNKVLCQAGTHIIATGSLIGDADALIEVTGGRLEYDGILRNTNINGHGGLVTGGQLIFDGAHFVVGIVGSFDYSDWNVGYIQQSGTGELVVTASCTAEQFTGGGVVQGPSVQTWLAVKVTANNSGCNIEPSPRTRAEMVLALSGVDYCLFPIKGSRVYSLDGLPYIGNSSAAIISDLLGLRPLDDYSPAHFGWTSAQDATTQREKVQAMIDAVPANGGNIRFTKNTITPDAPLRATDGIYPGWVANDEMRRANKAFIVFNRKNINFYFDEGAVIDRSGDQIADTDYAVYASTFYVSKSENVWFHNPQIIGYQDDAALLADNKDQTSGDAIQFNSGCDYVGVIGGHLQDGTSGVTVGYNRTAAEASFDPALAPVTNFRMVGTLVEGFEHKALLSDVDGFEVDLVGQGWTRANASVSETQRGVYLEGCKNGTVKAHLWDVFKTSLLVGNKGVENVDVDLWVHSMKTNASWVADTGGNLDTVYNGIAATFATETAKNVTVNIHKARSATTVTMSEVGHKDITLNLGDCHAAFAGVRTLTQITDQTALVDNPITGLKLTGQILVDATLTGYSGLTPNTGLLINSAAVDGSGDPIFGEVLLDNLSVKSTNRNARVLNFNGAVNGGEFLQTRGQASARSYDFNYNGDINFTGQTVISDDREFNGPSDASTLVSNVVQFFSAMKAKLWSLPYNGQNGLAPIGSARTGRQMHRLAGKMQMVSPHQNQQDSLAHYEVEVVPATGAAGVETETRVISFNISGKDLPDAGHSIRGIRGEAIGDGGSAKVRSVRTNSYGVNGHDGLLVGHMISSERRGLIPTSLGGNGTTDVFADAVAGPFGTEDASVIGQVGPGVRHVFLAQGATGPTRPQYVFAQSGGNAAILPEIATVLSHGGGNGDAWHHYDDAAFTTLLAKMENDGSIVTPRTRAKDAAVVIADETTHSITVPSSTGFMRLWSEGSSDRYFSIHFRATSSPSFAEIVKGSVVELFNTVNTGTDGNMVVNVLDGVVTVRNRAGASININWAFEC